MGFEKTSFFVDSDKEIKPHRDTSIESMLDTSYNRKDTGRYTTTRLYQKGSKLDNHRLSRVMKYIKGD